MEGIGPIMFLLVVLKVPVLGAIWLIWWASHQQPEPVGASDAAGGCGRRRPQPTRPRGPRRGPHGGGARIAPPCPPGGRTRVTPPPAPVRAGLAHARGATRTREHSDA